LKFLYDAFSTLLVLASPRRAFVRVFSNEKLAASHITPKKPRRVKAFLTIKKTGDRRQFFPPKQNISYNPHFLYK